MVCDNSKGFDEEPEEEYEITGEDLIELGVEGDLPKDMMAAADDIKAMVDEELSDVTNQMTDTSDTNKSSNTSNQVENLFGTNTNRDNREAKPWDETNAPTPLPAKGEEPLPWNSVGMSEAEIAAMQGQAAASSAPIPLPARKETPGQIQARLDMESAMHGGRNAEKDAEEEEAYKQFLLERQRAEGDGTTDGASKSHETSTNEQLDAEEEKYDDVMVDYEDYEDMSF